MAYLFALFMINKSITANNISVFKDLVIKQLGLAKENPQFSKLLIIWWGDLKIKVQMLSMKALGIGMNQIYN